MRVSLKWLADYIDLVLPADEIAERLTMSGCEVSKIERVGEEWQSVYVGMVSDLAPHPNADRLQLVTVDYGRGTTTVVAGAFNIKVGDKVPLALEGAKVFDPYAAEPKAMTVRATKLRGVVSAGMVCSSKELGLSDDHSGILILDPDAQVGRPLQDELGDVVFELEVTPNRADLLSMIGVAREVGALTGQAMRYPPVSYEESGPEIGSLIAIEILDPDLCARYSATYLEGVQIGPSPKWMRDRLTAAGMRPINNVVDITNYVMIEYGQPLHAFDYKKLRGHRIIVRRARADEQITTLDGIERTLNPDTLVIADAEHPVAVAGVMGGADSEVDGNTVSILLESANFNPVSIRRTSRALRLPSEASRRFEKGLASEQTVDAARRATMLMQQLAGGNVGKGAADCDPRPRDTRFIAITPREVRRVLGLEMDADQIVRTLAPLGFVTESKDSEIIVAVPPHRGDVMLAADITEELARILSYDAIPSTPLAGPIPGVVTNETLHWEDVLRDTMIGSGFSEIICYSLTSRARLSKLLVGTSPEDGPAATVPDGGSTALGLAKEIDRRLAWTAWPPARLVNPLSEDSECLRITAFGSLLETLRDNLRHESRDVLLFEIGRVYVPRDGDLPEQRVVLTAISGALRSTRPWGGQYAIDFFDLKGVAEVILTRLGIAGVEFVAVEHPIFQVGRAAAIVSRSGGSQMGAEVSEESATELLGVVGEVSPQVSRNFDIDQRAYLLCLDLERLLPRATSDRRYEPQPRFPAIVQDIAVVVGQEVPASVVRDMVVEAGGALVRDIELFDVYVGSSVPEGKKSLAYRITFQSTERTLTDEEVSGVRERIVGAVVSSLGASLRE